MSLPYPIYSNNVVARNFILLLHHLVVYVAIMLIFQVPVNLNTLLIVPAMIILCVTGSWVAILLGFISARFRDIKQVIVSLLQIALFVTPILWAPAQLGASWQATLLVNINPLFHFVTIARAPLLGQQPSMINWMVSIGVSVLGWFVTMRVLSKYYKHLVFWL
jgi:lipopolysaccharide transport system permease protein